MARRPPDEDPRVTDLRRYRKAREQARRKPAKPPRPSILGSNPRAGLILAVVVLVLIALYFVPRLL